MAATLKLSTASVRAALRKASVPVAEISPHTGRVYTDGAKVTTVNHAWANGKIQRTSYVTWRVVDKARYRALTDQEREDWLKQVNDGLARVRTALVAAGYVVTDHKQFNTFDLVVTLG